MGFGLALLKRQPKELIMTYTQEDNQKKGNKPTHILYVTNYSNGKPVQNRVGVAWKHEKGNGLNISLDSIVAFENKPKDQPTTSN